MQNFWRQPPQFWYKKNCYSLMLLPLAGIYYCIIALRKLLYRMGIFKTTKLPVPVIIIGNLSVGGTGKTPLVIALAQHLRQLGYNPGIVSRGYIPHVTRSQPLLVDADSDSLQVGDEALLIARHTQCPMAVASSRVAAAQLLLRQYNCDVIISDDGLQHYALQRNIEIAVIDAERGLGNGYCLPAGPLRETRGRLRDVAMVVINCSGSGNNEPRYDLPIVGSQYQMHMQPRYFCQLGNLQVHERKDCFCGKTVHAVAGIGNPRKFFVLLRSLGIIVIEHPFPDHHFYRREELDFGADALIIMTEKDAVKCTELGLSNCWYLTVTAELDAAFFQQVARLLKK